MNNKPWANLCEFGGGLAFKRYMRPIEGEQYVMIPVSELGAVIEETTRIRVGHMKVKIDSLRNAVQRLKKLNSDRKRSVTKGICRRCLSSVEAVKDASK